MLIQNFQRMILRYKIMKLDHYLKSLMTENYLISLRRLLISYTPFSYQGHSNSGWSGTRWAWGGGFLKSSNGFLTGLPYSYTFLRVSIFPYSDSAKDLKIWIFENKLCNYDLTFSSRFKLSGIRRCPHYDFLCVCPL